MECLLSVLNDRLSGLVQTRLGIKSDFRRFYIGNKLNLLSSLILHFKLFYHLLQFSTLSDPDYPTHPNPDWLGGGRGQGWGLLRAWQREFFGGITRRRIDVMTHYAFSPSAQPYAHLTPVFTNWRCENSLITIYFHLKQFSSVLTQPSETWHLAGMIVDHQQIYF